MDEARRTYLNRRIHAELLDIEKHLAYMDVTLLDQLIFRRNKDGYMCIVKAIYKGHPRVAFLQAATLLAAMEMVGEFAAEGWLQWGQDKWPSKFSQEDSSLK